MIWDDPTRRLIATYCVDQGIPYSRFLRWDEDDQDIVIEVLRRKAKICSGCGTTDDEWAEDETPYVAVSTICQGCEALRQEEDNIPPSVKGARAFLVPLSEAKKYEPLEP